MYFDTASAVSFRQQHSDSGCINTELLSPLDKDLGPEAFLSHSSLALHMARFPEAERPRLHKMIRILSTSSTCPSAVRKADFRWRG